MHKYHTHVALLKKLLLIIEKNYLHNAYQNEHHWLIFLFESIKPIVAADVTRMDFDEGKLQWVPVEEVAGLGNGMGLPETDRRVMWPNAQKHRGGFFMVEIDCSIDPFEFRVVESSPRTNS